MRLLLDTHLLLWATGMSRRLPIATRQLLENPEHEIYYSAANLWEITIKSSLGRPDFQVDPERLLTVLPEMDFIELPITAGHAAAIVHLPTLHKDPFDRLLIAQAIVEDVPLLSVDSVFVQYPSQLFST